MELCTTPQKSAPSDRKCQARRPFQEYGCLQVSLAGGGLRCTLVRMVTLAEIESAAAGLSPAEKQELMLFLASRLRAEGAPLPEPRTFMPEEIAGWISEDEADMRRLRERP